MVPLPSLKWPLPSLGDIGSQLLDLLLPPVCVACHQPILAHGQLCADCWGQIDFITDPKCDRLGLPLPYGTGKPLISAAALAAPPRYDRARAAAQYNGVIRDLIHAFKFRDRHEAVDLFARWLMIAGSDILTDCDLLLPVPLYRSRLWARRFNQSALLAQALARLTKIPTDPTLLQRRRATRQQVGLSMRERRQNVADAFQLAASAQNRVKNCAIVLIDDVITTGATADSCAEILKQAGAQRVDVLALARVTDPLRADL